MTPSPLEQQLRVALTDAATVPGMKPGPLPPPAVERQSAAALSVLLPHLERCREALREAQKITGEFREYDPEPGMGRGWATGGPAKLVEGGEITWADDQLFAALHDLDKLIGDDR